MVVMNGKDSTKGLNETASIGLSTLSICIIIICQICVYVMS